MTTRAAYAGQIQELKDSVVTMASMVDKAIARSIDALKTQNVELAWTVRRADQDINDRRWTGEEQALTLMATQAPMAGDLRKISACLHIFTELERMGLAALREAPRFTHRAMHDERWRILDQTLSRRRFRGRATALRPSAEADGSP